MCIPYYALALGMVYIATTSPPPVWFEPVLKQLYCDVINSHWAVDAVNFCIQCEREIDACEGVSIEKNQSSSIYTCKVCLVKAVKSPMTRLPARSYNTQIYRRIIDTKKGTPNSS